MDSKVISISKVVQPVKKIKVNVLLQLNLQNLPLRVMELLTLEQNFITHRTDNLMKEY